MNKSDAIKKIRTQIQDAQSEVISLLEAFLKKQGAAAALIDLQIYLDDFEIAATMVNQEGSVENLAFKKKPYAPIFKFLEKLPEPKTKEGFKERESLFVEVQALICQAIFEAWTKIKPKPKVEAYVRVEDDLSAIDLSSGKKVDVDHYESRLSEKKTKTQKIQYSPLSEKEKSKLPDLFAKSPDEMSDDEIEKEIEEYFQFLQAELDRIQPELVEAFRAHLKTHADELQKGEFIDLGIENAEQTHLFCGPIPKGFKDYANIPLGKEINLGKQNPFAGLLSVSDEVQKRVLGDSDRCYDTESAIRDLKEDFGVATTLKKAWDQATKGKSLPPAFVRTVGSNSWYDLKEVDNFLMLKDVQGQLKKKK